MIVKLCDPGFAFLSVCHLDSEEDLRPQRAGSNIFCCRTIISVIFSLFFSLQPHGQEYVSMEINSHCAEPLPETAARPGKTEGAWWSIQFMKIVMMVVMIMERQKVRLVACLSIVTTKQ